MDAVGGALAPVSIATTRYPFQPPRYVVPLLILEAAIGLALARYGVRFDGFIDVHRTPLGDPASLRAAIVDQIGSIVVPFAILAAFVRARDRDLPAIVGAGIVAAMRVPILVVGWIILRLPVPAMMSRGATADLPPIEPGMVVFALVSLACVVAACALLVIGLRRATGLRGGALALQSIGVFLFAEFAAKMLIVAAR